MSDARHVLEELIRERGEDYSSLSRLLGRNAAYIQQFIRRGTPRRLSEEDRHTLARYFRIDEALLGGPASAPPLPPAGRKSRKGEMVRVPRLAVGASAGSGALGDDERRAGHIAFDPTYVRTLGSAPDMLSAIKVQGDSMVPTLGDGDDIIVDRGDAAAGLRDGIYVLRLDDALNVKRLARNPVTGLLTIRSDNPAYPSFGDCDPARIEIIGRVVWVGRRVT